MSDAAAEHARRALRGATLRRPLAVDDVVGEDDVAPSAPVARGAEVALELRRGPLVVRGRGTLERAARLGEVALVRLAATEAPIRGTLVGPALVVVEATP